MTDKHILLQIEHCADTNDLQGFEKQVDQLLAITNEASASQLLSAFLMNQYTTATANSCVQFLEIILNKNPELALVNLPDNSFFQVAIVRGSFELYQCYRDEALESYLYDKTSDEAYQCYLSLNTVADRYNTMIFERLSQYIKGKDYKGAVASNDKDPSLSLIKNNDLDFMERIIEYYNGILGRRDILKDIETRLTE